MSGKRSRKKRVDFRQNRHERRRTDDWTQRWHGDDPALQDHDRGESVRPKGELSRRRTILVDEADAPRVDEALWLRGTVVKVHGLIAFVDDGQRVWACTVRRILRTLSIQTRSPVTCGDRVWISDQSALCAGRAAGVVERVEARRTVLSRRDFRGREHALVANADQLLIVVSVAEPRFRPHLVDRYIVAALKGRLRPVICVNKIDLLDAGSVTDAESDAQGGGSTAAALDELAALGYDCLRTSATSGAGLAALRDALRDRVTALSGQSGVGKSSLLNAVQPGLGLSTRAVSTETEKGRHTTTHAELLRLEVGGYVADTPGVRAWDLWGVAREELEALFEEFVPFVPQCRYKNCLHRDEEGCAVRAAAQAGAISARRYFSYVKMLDEV